ncbi:phage tail sheath subtilisin-like domain-containing protein [Ideonella sp. DXS29W]|uniref:Phage tail sheath subtilisin-like domain-containing protein n=1 Tax=Ideonella lacteola TaxID=2984193 RepID=A0ABU9BYB2_9BURK
MPVAVSFPGVYVEELPSGVRTITGVATSITAFVGRTAMGTDEPTLINTFGDFERQFGGLDPNYPLSYAIRDFFQNGGAKAVIVRIYKKKTGEGVNEAAKISLTNLDLVAASRGSWGNALRVRIDDKVSEDVATRYGLANTDLFNLTVRRGSDGATETFVNLTVKESPRRVDRVLLNESALLRVADSTTLPGTSVPPKHAEPGAGKTIWTDDAASAPVADAGKASDSEPLDTAAYQGSEANKTGLYALKKTDLFNLMCIPPDTREGDTASAVYSSALDFCVQRRAMLIVDPPAAWNSANVVTSKLDELGLSGERARNAALFFPRVRQPDPRRDGQLDTFAPSGAIAGLIARTDTNRGIWKAPAGVDAAVSGAQGLAVSLTNEENGQLNPIGVNCLRTFPIIGTVAWGSRTMRGADLLADEYKYIPVRRTALYIEESLYRGLQWVVFEPNDEPLWAQIRLNAGAFMHNLFRQGAFQGASPRDAYFVKCDKETTTQNDINLGIVNVVVGFAPLKPAEFVIIKLQQMAGQIDV